MMKVLAARSKDTFTGVGMCSYFYERFGVTGGGSKQTKKQQKHTVDYNRDRGTIGCTTWLLSRRPS